MALLVVRAYAGTAYAGTASKDCGIGFSKTPCNPCKSTASSALTPLNMNGPELMNPPGVFYFKFKFGAPTAFAPAGKKRWVTFSESEAITGNKTMNKYTVNFKAGSCPTTKGTVPLDVWGDASGDHRATASFTPADASGDLEIYARVDFKEAGTCASPNCAYLVMACGAGVMGGVSSGDWNKICVVTTTTTTTPIPTTVNPNKPYKYNFSDPNDCSRYGQDQAFYDCKGNGTANKPKCCCGYSLAGLEGSLQCLQPGFDPKYVKCPSAPTPVAGPCPTTTITPKAVSAGPRMAVSLLMAPVLSVGAVLFMA